VGCGCTPSTTSTLRLLVCLQVPDPCVQHNLLMLTGLSNLQSLSVKAPGADMPAFDQPSTPELRQFPGRLTCLTELQLPLEVSQDISSIGECVYLRNLRLHAAFNEASVVLAEDEWAALLQLTHLTCLRVEAMIVSAGAPDNAEEAFYGVLRQLQELRVVGAHFWTMPALPVLQSLTNITAVFGGWDSGENVDLNGLACPHINELGKAWGEIPWQVLPNLTCLTLKYVSPEYLQALCTSCSSLQKLMLCPPHDPYVRLGHAEYVSAFASLAKLQHLAHLELSALNDAELMAFTNAAAASTQQLQYLHVIAPPAMLSLLQLLKVRGLRELSLHVRHDDSMFSDSHTSFDDVRGVLVGLAHVPKVSLVLCTEQQRNVVVAARKWAADLGLPMPAVLKVSVCTA
jgi:hypothetical protein